jgi:thiamine kinase-like enzyme
MERVTAFRGGRCFAAGTVEEVTRAMREEIAQGGEEPVLVFDDATGRQIDLPLRARQKPEAEPARSPGRPRLGVLAREVTLLPRHWEWLQDQSGGASAALRRLVDAARKAPAAGVEAHTRREAAYRFMTAMAGDERGYEEALRALFSGSARPFLEWTECLAPDVRKYLLRLAAPTFGEAPWKSVTELLGAHVPAAKLSSVQDAFSAVFGQVDLGRVERLTTGASGAGIFRVMVRGESVLLRIAGATDAFRDPAREYACMRIASDAGVAPRLLHATAENGVVLTDFISSAGSTEDRRVNTTPAERLGMLIEAVKTLHAAPRFPPLVPYLQGVASLLSACRETGILIGNVLDEPLEAVHALMEIYKSPEEDLVSSHNDLHPGNVLFAGDRAWMVDWESAFLADRFIDLAAIVNFFTTTEDERESVLRGYFGDALNDRHRMRLVVMQVMNRLFYAAVLLNFAAAAEPELRIYLEDFETFTTSQIRAMTAAMASRPNRVGLRCGMLAEAMRSLRSKAYIDAVAQLRNGHLPRGKRARRR